MVSIITIMDLTGVARVLIADTFPTFEIWIVVGLIYLALSYAMLYGLKRLEYRLSGHLRAGPEVAPGAALARLAPAAGAPGRRTARSRSVDPLVT